ncbi:MAG: hypothetical protein NC419_02545 [Muribaculaceae bacterium]|nr:hypothetical protein [Muribaculaceae bacterium]
MEREQQFTQTLEKLKRQAKEQGNCLLEEQIKEAFDGMGLSEPQLEAVYDYFRQHKIGIGEPVNLDDYISREEADYLDDYLRQLEELPKLSEGETEAATLSAMAGDGAAQNLLIQVFLPHVVEIAKLYTGQGVLLEDLIGEGNAAVAMGVTMLGAFEHAREAQGALGRMIMDAMEEAIAENGKEESKDKKLADKVNLVADKANELAEDLHRKVTVDELAQETGMSRKSILDAIQISGDKIESLQKDSGV